MYLYVTVYKYTYCIGVQSYNCSASVSVHKKTHLCRVYTIVYKIAKA